MAINATAGSSTANSYATEAEADDYLANSRLYSDSWASQPPLTKERALRMATLLIDELAFFGLKTFSEGSLKWPRSSVLEARDSTVLLDSDTIPTKLKYATAELAFLLTSEDRTVQEGGTGISELTVSVIRLKFDQATQKTAVSDSVLNLLIDYIDFSSSGRITGSDSGISKVLRT